MLAKDIIFVSSRVNWLSHRMCILFYFVFSLVMSQKIGITMLDDGLRHIAFAANEQQMQSWGHVFPFSLFGQDDPWFIWHSILRFLINFTGKGKVHVWVNFFFLFSLCALVDYLIRKDAKRDINFLLPLSVFFIVACSLRYLNLRPDNFSGLYVLLALCFLEAPFSLIIITLLYAVLYYLFFVQVAFIGLLFVVQKRWISLFSISLASAFALIGYFFLFDIDYWGILYNTYFVAAGTHAVMTNELYPLFPNLGGLFNQHGLLLVGLQFIGVFWIVYTFYYFLKNRTLLLFLILTEPLWFSKVRFFELYIPIFGVLLLLLAINYNKIILQDIWSGSRIYLQSVLKKINRNNFLGLIVLFLFGGYFIIQNYCYYQGRADNKYKIFQEPKFNNKLILMNTLNTYVYQGLYLNPSLQFIPSCEVNAFSRSNKRLNNFYYKLLQNQLNPKEIAFFAHQVHANYYFHVLSGQENINFLAYKKQGLILQNVLSDAVIFKVV